MKRRELLKSLVVAPFGFALIEILPKRNLKGMVRDPETGIGIRFLRSYDIAFHKDAFSMASVYMPMPDMRPFSEKFPSSRLPA
jgi:hypothetical protein